MSESARRQRGFTLVELCASITTMVLVFSVVGFLLHRSIEGSAREEGYARDLRQVRAAMSAIEEDLRHAESAEMRAGSLDLRVASRAISYSSDERGLIRIDGAEARRWHAVRNLDVEREGSLVRFWLGLRRREAPSGAEPLVLSSAIHLRRVR